MQVNVNEVIERSFSQLGRELLPNQQLCNEIREEQPHEGSQHNGQGNIAQRPFGLRKALGKFHEWREEGIKQLREMLAPEIDEFDEHQVENIVPLAQNLDHL